jgi:hypothetical protein
VLCSVLRLPQIADKPTDAEKKKIKCACRAPVRLTREGPPQVDKPLLRRF